MQLMSILWALLILAGLGFILGLGLAISSKIFYVKEDNRIETVAEMLPNYNCGSCGYAGCKSFAEAIVSGKALNLTKCKPGKPDQNFNKILEYLNKEENFNDNGEKVNIKL